MPTAEPFVVLQAGACSFCHLDRTGVRTLLGMPRRDASICDQCVALGWDLLAAEVELDPASDLHGRVSFDDVAFDEGRFRERIDATARRLARRRTSCRAAGTGAEGSVDSARGARARSTMPAFRCSFCDAHRADILKLVSGPGTFICDECIEAATPVIIDALRT